MTAEVNGVDERRGHHLRQAWLTMGTNSGVLRADGDATSWPTSEIGRPSTLPGDRAISTVSSAMPRVRQNCRG